MRPRCESIREEAECMSPLNFSFGHGSSKHCSSNCRWRVASNTQFEGNGGSMSGARGTGLRDSISGPLARSIQRNGTANVENGGTWKLVGWSWPGVLCAFGSAAYGWRNSRTHGRGFMNAPDSALHGGSWSCVSSPNATPARASSSASSRSARIRSSSRQ
jgi:hypothetical protein